MKTIYEISTGKALRVDAIDAKEILLRAPDLYTDRKPDGVEPEAFEASAPAVNLAGEPAPHERKLTVAELRETLTARGVAFPEGAKKGELQAIFDAHNTPA